MTSANIKKSVKLKKEAQKIIHRRMLYAAGLGLIPIPVVDVAAILGIQMLMIKDIAKLYGVPFKEHLVKSFIGSLAGSAGAMSVVKAIPVMGSIIGAAAMSVSGAASTYAIGKVFVKHFDQGGTLLNFDPVKSQKYFHKLYEEGEKETARLKANKPSKIGTLAKKIVPSKIVGATTIQTTTNEPLESAAELEAKKLAKAKRVKALIARRKKKARIKKIKRYILLLLIIGIGGYWYLQNYMKSSTQSTEIDLFMKEARAKHVDLQPSGDLDSLTITKITHFSSNSTEYAIAKHIQSSDATYPRRLALSAVRFNGNSDALSTGAKDQLSNIAFLMKKYPALTVNLYGHTTNVGPEFNRKRIGRDRARVLKDVFVNLGIPSYRITGNYIEKSSGTHDEYWGAEIVIDVSTEENAVAIKTPILPSPSPIVPSFISDIISQKEEFPKKEPIIEVEEQQETSTVLAPTEMDSLDNLQLMESDTLTKELEESTAIPIDSSEVLTSIENTVVKESEEPVVAVSEKKPLPLSSKKKEKKAATPSTTEGVMRQYIESSNPKYPKIFSLSHILFPRESDELNARGKKQLVNIAKLLQEFSDLKIVIYGHTSYGGSEKMSQQKKEKLMLKWQKIGQDRARNIKKELHHNGVSNKRMMINARRQRKEPTEPYWGAELVITN